MTHGELEDRLSADMREVICQLFQDHMDLRADHEERLGGVTGAQGASHGAVEAGHERSLATVFGEVTVRRLAYRHRGEENLYLADAALNMPEELYSHGLRCRAAEESSRGSFDEAVEAIERATGQHVPKRQVEELHQAGGGRLRSVLRRCQAGRGPRFRRARHLRRRQGHRHAA